MKPSSVIIVASFISLLVSFWNRNDLPGQVDYVPALDNEPRQTATREQPFRLVYNDVQYEVAPEYEYDITGMVVSYRHHHEGSACIPLDSQQDGHFV